MTLEDGKKLAAMLSDDALTFCTCEICIPDYAQALSVTFPEVRWRVEDKKDGSCESILLAEDPL